jgi:deazaflavin-dependent oxidoreductase (nitroreductase family)
MKSLRVRHSFMRTVDRLTRLIYRLSAGRLGRSQGKFRMLLLTTTGRKTGKTRTHTLLFIRDGERYVVVASNFGAPYHPGWYLNLHDNPHASLQDGRTHLEVSARDATGEERERLWQQLVKVWPYFASYQRGNPRVIPVVILSPEPAPSAAS